MKRFTKNSQAFTLVETLVAIAILMISISGPLAVANKALTAALYAKDQSTASFLAQEEMEVIKNLKDNGAASGSGWLSWLNGNACNSSSSRCELSFVNNSSDSLLSSPTIIDCTSSSCLLYTTDKGYDANKGVSDGSPTIFHRYFYLTPLNNNNPKGANYNDEYIATVVVSWNEGTIPNAVTMQSELLNVAP
jgi:Tfp pilus assembly protein PilV